MPKPTSKRHLTPSSNEFLAPAAGLAKRVAVQLILMSVWVAANSVYAQDSSVETVGAETENPADSQESVPAPENEAASAQARTHYRSGMEHFQARRFRPAVEEFQLAVHLVPSADLWFNIARAHEEMGELELAAEHFRLYLRDRVDPPDRAAVEARIEALTRRVAAARLARQNTPTSGTVRLQANVEGATVLVDGRARGTTPDADDFELEPGAHEIELQLEGYIPFFASVRVEAGMTTGAYADLLPETQYRARHGSRLWTWIVGGLAIVGIGAGIGLGVHAAGLRDENLGEARDWAQYSDIAVGIGGVLAVGALVLYFIEGRSVGTERFSGPQPASD